MVSSHNSPRSGKLRHAQDRTSLLRYVYENEIQDLSTADAWLRRVPQVLKGRSLAQDPEVLSAFDSVASRVLSNAAASTSSDWHLSGLFWSSSKLGYSGLPKVIQAVERRLLQHPSVQLEPIDCSLILWSYSQVKNSARINALVLERLVDTIDRTAQDFEPMGIATTLWSLAKMGCPTETFARAAEAFNPALLKLAQAGVLEPQNVSNVLWSFGTLSFQPDKAVLTALVDATVGIADRGGFSDQNPNGQAVANILWGLAKISAAPEFKVVEEKLRPVLLRAPSEFALKPMETSNALWAYATVRVKPCKQVCRAFLNFLRARNTEFNQSDIAFVLGAFAKLSMAPEFYEAHDLSTPVLLRENPSRFHGHVISNVLQAYGEMRVEPDHRLGDAFFVDFDRKISKFRLQDTVQVLLAFAQLSLPPPSLDVFFALLENLTTGIRTAAHRHSANAVWAIALQVTALFPSMLQPMILTSPVFHSAFDSLKDRLHALGTSGFGDEELTQIMQAHLMLKTLPGAPYVLLDAGSLLLERAEASVQRQAEQAGRKGELQEEIGRCVRMYCESVGAEGPVEMLTDDGLFRLHLALPGQVALEVCSPSRYLSNARRIKGSMVARRHILQSMGWTVILVPFYEFSRNTTEAEKVAYVGRLITGGSSGSPTLSAASSPTGNTSVNAAAVAAALRTLQRSSAPPPPGPAYASSPSSHLPHHALSAPNLSQALQLQAQAQQQRSQGHSVTLSPPGLSQSAPGNFDPLQHAQCQSQSFFALPPTAAVGATPQVPGPAAHGGPLDLDASFIQQQIQALQQQHSLFSALSLLQAKQDIQQQQQELMQQMALLSMATSGGNVNVANLNAPLPPSLYTPAPGANNLGAPNHLYYNLTGF